MKYTDEQILLAIQQGNDDKVLGQLYKHLMPKVKRYILSNNGDNEEAEDIFQDAILIFYKQVKLGKFKDKYEINGFVYSVCRNLWINRVKKRNRNTGLSSKEYALSHDGDMLQDMITEERERVVMEIFSMIGERCKELLVYSVFHKYSMKEICQKMGFSTENAAKTKNYKCKQKLISLVGENKAVKNLLRG